MQRFVQEAKLASALTHPNVAYIHEIGEDARLRFLAMEYVEGEPLSARLSRGPLSISGLLSVGIQVADALDDAHSKGIVHRDIKPSNLMLTPRGTSRCWISGSRSWRPAAAPDRRAATRRR